MSQADDFFEDGLWDEVPAELRTALDSAPAHLKELWRLSWMLKKIYYRRTKPAHEALFPKGDETGWREVVYFIEDARRREEEKDRQERERRQENRRLRWQAAISLSVAIMAFALSLLK